MASVQFAKAVLVLPLNERCASLNFITEDSCFLQGSDELALIMFDLKAGLIDRNDGHAASLSVAV